MSLVAADKFYEVLVGDTQNINSKSQNIVLNGVRHTIPIGEPCVLPGSFVHILEDSGYLEPVSRANAQGFTEQYGERFFSRFNVRVIREVTPDGKGKVLNAEGHMSGGIIISGVKPFEEMDFNQLRAMAKAHGIETTAKKKDELVAALKATL